MCTFFQEERQEFRPSGLEILFLDLLFNVLRLPWICLIVIRQLKICIRCLAHSWDVYYSLGFQNAGPLEWKLLVIFLL